MSVGIQQVISRYKNCSLFFLGFVLLVSIFTLLSVQFAFAGDAELGFSAPIEDMVESEQDKKREPTDSAEPSSKEELTDDTKTGNNPPILTEDSVLEVESHGVADLPLDSSTQSEINASIDESKIADGWQELEGKRFYYKGGMPLKGSHSISGNWYRFDMVDGHMLVGDQEIDGRFYRYDQMGRMLFGSQYLNGKWYRFDPYIGCKVFGSQYIDGNWYRYDLNDGNMLFGSQKIDGKWYQYDTVAGYMRLGPQNIEGSWYWYDPFEGFMRFGLQSINGQVYSYNRIDGKMQFGAQNIDGKWHLFHKQAGFLLTDNNELVSNLVTIAQQLGLDSMSPESALRVSFDYVVNNYRYISGSIYPEAGWSVPFALEMINNKGGNCYRFAALYAWLAAYCGYGSNVVSGAVPSYSQGLAPHAWTEVYLDGNVYICDTDMANAMPYLNWYLVSYANAPVQYYR